MKLTIKEIAQQAGVSITTVSQIINNKGGRFSPATRKKVLEIIEKNNYKPDFFAQNMISRRSNTVGMIIPDVTDLFFSKVVEGVQTYLNEQGIMILLCNSQSDQDKEEHYIQELLYRSVDGIILATPHAFDYEALKEKATKKHTPFVLVDRGKSPREEGRLIVNENEGIRRGIEFLIENGHRHIGMVREDDGYYNLSERYDIYRQVLSDYHLPFSDSQVVSGKLTLEGGYEAGKKLFANREEITAIFCANDEMAAGVYRAAEEYGKKIPQDLSVLGFDNLEIGEYLLPSLTTIHQPTFEIGKQAGIFMHHAIAHPGEKIPNYSFETKLMIRNSIKRLTSF